MINPQWLELPLFRMHFHSPKDVRTIEQARFTYWNITDSKRETFRFSVRFYCWPFSGHSIGSSVRFRVALGLLAVPFFRVLSCLLSGKHAYIVLIPLNPTFIQ